MSPATPAPFPLQLDIFERGKQYTCGECGALLIDVIPKHLKCANGKCTRVGIVIMRPGAIQAAVNPQLSGILGAQDA